MAVSEELLEFVRDALSRGLPRAQIHEALTKAGWTADQTRAALAAFADVSFPIPVPRAKPYLSAREAFMYLVLFSTLYVSAVELGSLVFDFINRAFPDPASSAFANAESYVRESMRWASSALIVSFPVFLYTSWLTGREVRADPMRRASKVRRWLTYLTLFSAASVLLGDVTALVYNALSGELTVRFLLKIATVGLIAGTIFTYYLKDLRRDEQERPVAVTAGGGRILAAGAAVVVVAAVAGGVVLIGPPAEERVRRLDEQRVRDLELIQNGVRTFAAQNTRLPASFDEMTGQSGASEAFPRDPGGGAPYEYRRVDETTYELCATFDRSSAPRSGGGPWAHGPGRRCFRRTPPTFRNAP